MQRSIILSGKPPNRLKTLAKQSLLHNPATELGDEHVELATFHVGDRPVGKSLARPVDHAEAAGRQALRRLAAGIAYRDRYESDEMLVMAVDERRHRSVIDHFDAAAHQRETL